MIGPRRRPFVRGKMNEKNGPLFCGAVGLVEGGDGISEGKIFTSTPKKNLPKTALFFMRPWLMLTWTTPNRISTSKDNPL